MADDYLVRDGPVSVPMEYVVPQGGELIPLMVIATMDGTSAVGSFYAAVQIIAPSGRVMGTAISDAIAAGASASVTWFPAAELTAAAAAGLPVSEVVYLNSKTGSVTASTVLANGVSYLLSVQGTYTDWNEDLANGTPEANAMFPTSLAGRISTQVGIDPDTIFAYPNDHPQAIGHWTQFEMNLGAGYAHVEPYDGAHTTPTTDHFYSYQVTGQGSAPSFRINDTPLNDNYGELKITIYAIPGGGGSGSGVASVTAADTSIIVGGTATNPTLRTATLDVIAADHPPAADWSNNSHKITSVLDPTLAQDAATKNYVDTHAGGTGTVTNVSSANTGIAVANPATTPVLTLATLDVIATDGPPAAAWSNNSKKITGLANGTAASDAAAFGQIPTSVSPATGSGANVQVFAAGAGQTWNKPAGAKTVQVVCVGAGGGGGGGQNSSTVSRAGGGGGGGGSVTVATYQASDLGNETVGVGAGGPGGAAGASGIVGTNGGNTTFGTHQSAFGGVGGTGSVGANNGAGGGGASTVAVGTTTTGGAPASATAIGSQGANASSGASGTPGDWGGGGGGGGSGTGSGGNGGGSIFAGPAGAGGGGNTGAGAAGTAGTGGTTQNYSSGGGAGQNTDGTAFIGPYCGGGGGGGQGGGTAGTAHVGGNGGRGAGGGGGGTGLTAKAGGNGGDGICIVTAW